MLRAAPRRTTVSSRTLVALAVPRRLLLIGWYVVVLGIRDSATMRIEVPSSFATSPSAMFIVAGVARLASWRMTRDWDAAVVAVDLCWPGMRCRAPPACSTTVGSRRRSRTDRSSRGRHPRLRPRLLSRAVPRVAQPLQRLVGNRAIMTGSTFAVTVALVAVLPGSPGCGSTHDRPVGRSRGDDHVRLDRLGLSHVGAAPAWARKAPILSWAVFAALLMARTRRAAAVELDRRVHPARPRRRSGPVRGRDHARPTPCACCYTQIRQRIVDDELGRDLLVRNDRSTNWSRPNAPACTTRARWCSE